MAQAERPALIITDIEMPYLNGIQMIAKLRAQQEFTRVPIMAISAYGSNELAAAVTAGADMAVPKPVDLDVFINHINYLLPARSA